MSNSCCTDWDHWIIEKGCILTWEAKASKEGPVGPRKNEYHINGFLIELSESGEWGYSRLFYNDILFHHSNWWKKPGLFILKPRLRPRLVNLRLNDRSRSAILCSKIADPINGFSAKLSESGDRAGFI